MQAALPLTAPNGIDEQVERAMTLDLAVLAQVERGDRIEVERVADRTIELFARTIRILEDQHRPGPGETEPFIGPPPGFVPEELDLRERFLFAEALGSYSTLHDLVNGDSPAYRLFLECGGRGSSPELAPQEATRLEAYRSQIHEALIHANAYLLSNVGDGFTGDELHELNVILKEAEARFERITALLGGNHIREVERAVIALNRLNEKMKSVKPTVDGIFLVDSEVMFVPTNDLIDIVNTIFAAVGNPYVAQNVDGMLLLAGRNLLIQVVSFYSYYGKQQIYNAFKKSQGAIPRHVIARHVRYEIRKLFQACKAENRLVLKRVMAHAEREFEISVKAIRTEAEHSAIRAVHLLMPPEPPPPPPERQTILSRLRAWLFR
ncbi:MAG: hypothetical protein HY749_23415 [Gammaproteobacteria bacterium]|nr:hypothetical protein [Gammaproteobacteria bacterium]